MRGALVEAQFPFLARVSADGRAIYFFARLAHYACYLAGVPVLRTLTFVAGFAAQLALVVALLRGAP